HPDALFVLEALARGYFDGDRLADAGQACDLALARDPEEHWAWLWRGHVFERLGQFDKAEADYRRAVETAPDDREARLALGGLLARRRQPGPAAEQFGYVLGRDAADPEALLGLAGCLIEQGRPEEAVPLLDRVPAGGPLSPQDD